jgi:hypothetical protein
MRFVLLLLVSITLATCGQAAAPPTVVPATAAPEAGTTATAIPATVARQASATAVATSATTATRAPTATPLVDATSLPTIVPTATPRPTPTSRALVAIYECDAGLCAAPLDGAQVSTLVAFDHEQLGLAGLAASPDGRQVVYGLGELGSGQATLYSVDAGGGVPQRLFDVEGAESGNGGVEGFGALGFAEGERRIVFEDRAQVFIAAPDGSDRRPVNEQALYGASSWHWYVLSPQGGYLYQVGSGSPNVLTIYQTTGSYSTTVSLDGGEVPAAFLDEGQTLLVTTLDPSLDEIEGNPATRERTLTGYETYVLAGDERAPAQLGEPAVGGALPTLASNVVAGAALVNDDQGRLMLARLGSAAMTPADLPGRRENGLLVLAPAP